MKLVGIEAVENAIYIGNLPIQFCLLLINHVDFCRT